MRKNKAQIAAEYLTVTAFVMIVVILIFGFVLVNYDQNMKTARANDLLTTLSNIADEVYLLGEGNTRFVDVSFPNGIQKISVVNLCNDTTQLECNTGNETLCDCKTNVEFGGSGNHGGINKSAIRIEMSMLGGNTIVQRDCKGKIWLVNFPTNLEEMGEVAGGPAYTIRASWTDTGKIELRKV